jgi:hypothetical protein
LGDRRIDTRQSHGCLLTIALDPRRWAASHSHQDGRRSAPAARPWEPRRSTAPAPQIGNFSVLSDVYNLDCEE